VRPGWQGLEEIPTIIRGTETKDLLRDALLENLHRAQLNPLEEAAAYQQLLEDFGCTQDELSRRIKRSRPQIANTLRLMKLPRSVQRHLIQGSLTAGHARALLAARDTEEQVRIAETVVDDGLSVRATEGLVKSANDSKTTVKPHVRSKPRSDEKAVQLADRLADIYDTEVRVKRTKGRGTIVLTFESDDDLERLVGILDRKRQSDKEI
jgi:ParB family chromosome partitioning protein